MAPIKPGPNDKGEKNMLLLYGIYREKGNPSWYGGRVNKKGKPVTDGSFSWKGEWFPTKEGAKEFSLALQEDDQKQ